MNFGDNSLMLKSDLNLPGKYEHSLIENFTFHAVAAVRIRVESNVLWQVHKNQKQPSRSVVRKTCAENLQQIQRRASMPKCDYFSCKFVAYFQNTFL